MKMQQAPHYLVWYVDGRPIDQVCFYDETGVVLKVERSWIEARPSGMDRAIYVHTLDSVNALPARRKLNLTRKEHFVCKEGAGPRVLYLYLPLFEGYGTADLVPSHDNDTSISYMRELAVRMAVNGQPAEWLYVRAAYVEKTVDKPSAAPARAIMELFNEKVADHPNRHLSEWAAARLMKLLPELTAIVTEAEGK